MNKHKPSRKQKKKRKKTKKILTKFNFKLFPCTQTLKHATLIKWRNEAFFHGSMKETKNVDRKKNATAENSESEWKIYTQKG